MKNVHKKIFWYLSISFSFTWILWWSKVLQLHHIKHPLIHFFSSIYHFGAWGPFIAALCIALQSRKKPGLRSLIRKRFNLKFPKIWLLPTLFIFPIIIGLPLLILYLLEQPFPPLENSTNPIILPIVFFIILVNAGPLQEELGWRGILLEQLQTKTSALSASLMTGFIWGLWHIPLFFIPDQGFYYDKPFWGLIASTTLISIIFGWIYNNTNKNLLLMLILHTTYNFSHYMFPTLQSDPASQLYFVFLIFSVLIIILKSGTSLSSKKTTT